MRWALLLPALPRAAESFRIEDSTVAACVPVQPLHARDPAHGFDVHDGVTGRLAGPRTVAIGHGADFSANLAKTRMTPVKAFSAKLKGSSTR